MTDQPRRRRSKPRSSPYVVERINPNWLVACLVTSVAMEATGVFWIPVYAILEARGLEVHEVGERPLKMPVTDRDHPIEAFLLDRADEPFCMCIAVRCQGAVFESGARQLSPESARPPGSISDHVTDQRATATKDALVIVRYRAHRLNDECLVRMRRAA